MYLSVRLIIVFFPIFFFFKKIHKMKKKDYFSRKEVIKVSIVYSLLLISILTACAFPLEKYFLKFTSPEQAFNYTHTNTKVFRTIETKSGDFIITGEDCKIKDYTFIDKIDDKWQVIKYDSYLKPTTQKENDYDINYIDNNNGKILVLVKYKNMSDNYNNIKITDNKSSNFTYFVCKTKGEKIYDKYYYSVVDNINDYVISKDNIKINK